MNFKPEIKEIGLIENVFSKSSAEIVQGDIIVPDVMEDIGKILTADAEAVIESKDLSGGRLTVSGTVNADIIYEPQSGGIEAIHSKMTFSHTEKTESDDMDVYAHCRVLSADCNLYNPRKMNIRVNLGIETEGTRDMTERVLSSAESDYPTEVQTKNITAVTKHVHACDVIPFHETFDISSGSPSAVNVLKCTAFLTDRDFRLLANKAVIRGTLVVSVLYKGEDGNVSKVEFTKPLTEITDAPGAEEDMKENIYVTLSPFTAEPTANADGSMRAFFTEGKIFVETDCIKENTETVITDMFSTGCSLNLTLSAIPGMPSVEFEFPAPVRDIIPSDELKAKKIFSASAWANIHETKVSDGEISISGNTNTEILFLNNDGAYSCVTRNIPFSYNGTWEGEVPNVTAKAKGISAHLTGSGDAEIRFTVFINAKPKTSVKTNCITNAEISESENKTERPSLVVYYAKDGDTLWNIAKRYGVTRKNITDANGAENTFAEGQKIIIPR